MHKLSEQVLQAWQKLSFGWVFASYSNKMSAVVASTQLVLESIMKCFEGVAQGLETLINRLYKATKKKRIFSRTPFFLNKNVNLCYCTKPPRLT